jgi:hypothetical protein
MTARIRELHLFVRVRFILVRLKIASIVISMFIGVDLMVCLNGVVDNIFFLYRTLCFFEPAFKFLFSDFDFDSCFERCAFFIARLAEDTFHFLEIVLPA